jgi:hypothetical protein
MPKTKVDISTRLADELLRILESRRAQGDASYPPTLRRLAGLCDGPPTHEQILKAVRKQVFTKRAVIAEKTGKGPSFDSPVYFKEDVPKKPKPPKRKPSEKKPSEAQIIAELSARMLAVLESQRRLGGGAYPPTLGRLAELCERKGSDTAVPKAVSHAPMAGQAIVVAAKGKKPLLDAPVVLRADVEGGASAVLSALLKFALSPVTNKVKGKEIETVAFTPDDMKNRLVPALKKIGDVVEEGIEREALPTGVGWVRIKGKPHLFLLENLRPAAAHRPAAAVAPADRHAGPHFPVRDGTSAVSTTTRPARDFATAFREAFDRLDRRNGSTNFVKLSDLRQALPEFGREAFDAGLRALRIEGLFSLDSHEGLYGSITPEDREAGVREAGSLLVYASRR